MWECDGCGALFESDESPEAQEHFAIDLDKPDSEVKCWGLMEVGEGAWKDFHEKDIHPMSTFLNSLEDRLIETGTIVEVLKETEE